MRRLFCALLALFVLPAHAASCGFNATQYAAAVGLPASLMLVVDSCDAFVVNYYCEGNASGVPSQTLSVAATNDCVQLVPFQCTYQYSGAYAVFASLALARGLDVPCNSTGVNVSCGAGQDGTACSPPSCTPSLLQPAGRCSGGSCAQAAPLTCSFSNYCVRQSCGGALYDCGWNSSAAQFQWTAGNSSCTEFPSCPPPLCTTLNGTPALATYALSNLSCVPRTAACPSSGCCAPSCNGGSCGGTAGPCPDVCTPSSLKVSGQCAGCSSPGAAGTCAYSSLGCGPDNLCSRESCGQEAYYCTGEGGGFVWSANRLKCEVQATVPPEAGATYQATARPGYPQYVPAIPGIEGFGATPLPSQTAIERAVAVTAVPVVFGVPGKINVVGYYFEPAVISAGVKVRVFVFTDSASTLSRDIPCEGPSKCICRPPFNGSSSNFVCEMYPQVNGTYDIALSNSVNETGVFIAQLFPGRRALLLKVVVASRYGEFLFYASVFVAFCFLLYGLHHLYSVFERERRKGTTLAQQRQHLREEAEALKAAYMKGRMSEGDFKREMIRNQREITEVNARINEYLAKKRKDSDSGRS
ncbi:MAG: hypothetical protein V1787_05920 [Candidatus Micrarchaeota archaeon]